MRCNFRYNVVKFGVKAITGAASVWHVIVGVRDDDEKGYTPLLASSHSQRSAPKSSPKIHLDGEEQARFQRLEQWKAWIEERIERDTELDLFRDQVRAQQDGRPLVQNVDRHSAHIQPLQVIARSHHGLADSSSMDLPPMYEQQTGIICDQAPNNDEEPPGESSSSSSLRRRGALRRKANPLFARPKAKEFDRLRGVWCVGRGE